MFFKDNTAIWEDEEEVLLVEREHPVLLIIRLSIWALITAIPFIFEILLEPFFFSLDNSAFNSWLLIRDSYFLLSALGLFIILALYNLNVHLVTSKRVIDMDQFAVTRHHAVEAPLDRVQDVTSEIHGFWGHLFNYGIVHIQSAGGVAKIKFENVDNPKKIKRVILDAVYSHDAHKPGPTRELKD